MRLLSTNTAGILLLAGSPSWAKAYRHITKDAFIAAQKQRDDGMITIGNADNSVKKGG